MTAQLTQNLINYPGLDLKRDLAAIRVWMLMGEVCPRSLVSLWNERLRPTSELWNVYSTWESEDVSYMRLSNSDATAGRLSASKFASAGYPMPNVGIYVLDRTTGVPVPQGVLGDVFIGTRAMSHGYFNDPVKTRAQFKPNHFLGAKAADLPISFVSSWGDPNAPPAADHLPQLYATGDRGRLLADGQLEIAGRGDSIIKIRGFKVGLPYVENALRGCDGVHSACVCPVLDPETKQPTTLVAYIVGIEEGKGGVLFTTNDCERVLKQVRGKVPSYAVPGYVIAMSAFPTRPGSGKLDRKKLPDPLGDTSGCVMVVGSGSGEGGNALGDASKSNQGPNSRNDNGKGSGVRSGAGSSAERDQLEKIVTEAWRRVLGAGTSFGRYDNFFEVGGHSLRAATLVGDLTDSFGLKVSVLDLYSHPSVASLAGHIRHLQGGPTSNGAGNKEDVRKSRRHRRRDGESQRINRHPHASSDIAVIGLAGHFPGAPNIEAFWDNLQSGVDSVRKFTKEELLARGVPPHVIESDGFVPAGQVVDDADKFDAYFWGIGAEEARTMDPQQRMFLQTAWHALENAGYAPRSGSDFNTGVFAACGIDGYLIHHLDGGAPLKDPLQPGKIFKAEVGNEKDYIATRVSYNLDLGGPSFTVNSACSSGLVAVAQAAQAIIAGQCDVAIAGASSLTFPNFGYVYSEGLVASEDGHVRPFDAAASGTLFGDSVGAVVLKRMDDAVADGDHVWAVLKGSAVTNDGKEKAGYSAPSSEAQARAIVSAQRQAGVTSDTISYVECHATATHVGDAIEMRGLAQAFAATKQSRVDLDSGVEVGSAKVEPSCALGSVKGNIGHANCAAGITGFIKTVLCLHHRKLVPTAHFEKINDKIDFSGTPFYVHRELSDWDHHQGNGIHVRRAGVSSFGVGGTNAHLVLEEAPRRTPDFSTTDEGIGESVGAQSGGAAAEATISAQRSAESGGDEDCESGADQILVFSAKTSESLRRVVGLFAVFLRSANAPPLRDIAYTLSIGREHMQYRVAISSRSKRDAAEQLAAFMESGTESSVFKNKIDPKGSGKAIFVFPGQGSQYLGMGKQLYESEPRFRQHMDECAAIVDDLLLSAGSEGIAGSGTGPPNVQSSKPILSEEERAMPGMGLLSVMYALWSEDEAASEALFTRPALVQPCIFATEYALGRTLQDYGVQPVALGGHSIGEYVAATLSGVFSLKVALELILLRGVATERYAKEGSMLSVKMSEADLNDLLRRHDGALTVAAANAPLFYVLSGETKACVEAKSWLESQGKRASLLHVNRAFHSKLMDGASRCLEDFLRRQTLEAPILPVTSNVTGAWMDGDDVTRPEYWGDHMRGTVKFVQNASRLLKWSPSAIIEAGPGSTLCKLIAKCQLQIAKDEAEASELSVTAASSQTKCTLIQAMRHPNNKSLRDSTVFSNMLGSLWKSGVDIDFEAVHTRDSKASSLPCRVPIPGYSFEPSSYWVTPKASIYVEYDAAAAEAEAVAQAMAEAELASAVPLSSNSRLMPLSAEISPGGQILFCFPYAGGSSRTFGAWAKEVERVGSAAAGSAQIIAVELPGRGARSDERLSDSSADDAHEISEIANAIRTHMRGVDNSVTCVLCGLSMGALIVWRVAALLDDLRGQLTGIMLAGRVPPFGPNAPPADMELTEEDLDKYNLASPEVRASEAWQDHFFPLLQSDLRLDARLAGQIVAKTKAEVTHAPPQLPSFLDLTVCCGMDDLSFPWISAMDWKAIGGSSFKLTLMQGGHEFLRERADELFTASVSQRGVPKQLLQIVKKTQRGDSAARGQPQRPSPLLRIRWRSLMPLEDLCVLRAKDDTLNSKIGDERGANLFSWNMDMNAFNVPTMRLSSNAMNIMDEPTVRCIADAGVLVILVVPFDSGASSGTGAGVEAPSATVSSDVLMDYEISQCWSFMKCAQTLIEGDIAARIMIVLPDELSGSMIVGASRSLSLEFPELETQRLFLRRDTRLSNTSAPNLIDAVLDSQGSLRSEPDIAIHGNFVQVRRAFPHRMQRWPSRSVLFDGGASSGSRKLFVVTGGTGGIGTELVNWLIDVQKVAAQRIVLLSRRASSASPHPRGCTMIKVDLSHSGALARCEDLQRVIQESDGVEGIFHLAGVLADSMMINMTREKLKAVAAPKAASLLELLGEARRQRWGAKWALAFSSTTSLLGYPGQSNYAAANSFLDGLMHVTTSSQDSATLCGSSYTRLLGGGGNSGDDKGGRAGASSPRIPVIACNWGPWGEVGMAQKGSKAYDQSLKGGELPMETKDALDALESLLRIVRDEVGTAAGNVGVGTLQFSVCRSAWSRSEWKGHPLIARLHDDIVPFPKDMLKVSAGAKPSASSGGGGARDGGAASLSQPLSEVEQFLAARVSSWMPSETLTALGVDSLDEVQLRNDFQRTFSTKIPLSTFVVPNQTLGALAVNLETHLASVAAP